MSTQDHAGDADRKSDRTGNADDGLNGASRLAAA